MDEQSKNNFEIEIEKLVKNSKNCIDLENGKMVLNLKTEISFWYFKTKKSFENKQKFVKQFFLQLF